MWNMLWPLLMVVCANTFYHVCAKSTPEAIDPFASLTVTYLVGALCSLVLFFVTSAEHKLGAELAKVNWTTLVLGVAIVGLEYGFLSMYRAGWKVSVAQLAECTVLSVVLIFVGALLYRENISLRQVAGVVVCGVGLFLIMK